MEPPQSTTPRRAYEAGASDETRDNSNVRKRATSPVRASTSSITTKVDPKRAIMLTSTEWKSRGDNDPRIATLQQQQQQMNSNASTARKPTAMTSGNVAPRPPAGPRTVKKEKATGSRPPLTNGTPSNGPAYTTEKSGDTRIKGPWTKEEDQMLTRLVKEHGPKKWSAIAQNVPGRIGKQCRERWLNHLDDSVKKTPWTDDEDQVLLDTQDKIGNRWCEIAKLLPGRPENAVKNRWNSLMNRRWSQKVYKEQGKVLHGGKANQQMQHGYGVSGRSMHHPYNNGGVHGNDRVMHNGVPSYGQHHMHHHPDDQMHLQQVHRAQGYQAYNQSQQSLPAQQQQMRGMQHPQNPQHVSDQQKPPRPPALNVYENEPATSLENLLGNSTELPNVVNNREGWINPKQDPHLDSLMPLVSPRGMANGNNYDLMLSGDYGNNKSNFNDDLIEPIPFNGNETSDFFDNLRFSADNGISRASNPKLLESFSRLSVDAGDFGLMLNTVNTPRGGIVGPISPTNSQLGQSLHLSNAELLASSEYALKSMSPRHQLLPGSKFDQASDRREHKQQFLRHSLGQQGMTNAVNQPADAASNTRKA